MQTDASFGIIPIRGSGAETQFLLIQHRHGGHWAFPKGHLDPGETQLQAAVREFHEETGLSELRVREDRAFDEQYIIDNRVSKGVRYWIADAGSGDVKVQAKEVQAYRWAPLWLARRMITFPGSRALLEMAAQHLGLMRRARVLVFESAERMARAAADALARIARAGSTRRGVSHVALAGGGTPLAAYRLLAGPPWRARIPWHAAHWWWGDERCVPPTDAESNYAQALGAFLGAAPAPKSFIHRVKGELGPAAACADYRTQLGRFGAPAKPAAPGPARAGRRPEIATWPQFDLVLLGLGNDGHTASLFPYQRRFEESVQPAVAVTAQYEGRPADRVTLTPLAFNSARHVIFMAAGAAKADAVADTLCGPRDVARRPAQLIMPFNGEVTWMLDEAAAAKLPADLARG